MSTNFYQRLKEKIQSANKILITTHIVPDADGIGSQVALFYILEKIGKKVFCVNEKDLNQRYSYLDTQKNIMGLNRFLDEQEDFIPDLIIIVDTNRTSRTGLSMSQFILPYDDIIYIDHHPYGKKPTSQHFIDENAAATGQIVGEFIEYLEIEFTKEIALPLYTAILIDTNTFRYPSVSSRTHLLVSKLLKTGVTGSFAYNYIYGSKSISNMHLLGEVLNNCQLTGNSKLAWIYISQELLDKYQADIESTHAFINNLLVLENVKIACMFRDDGKKVRLSLRSHGDIDVAELAQELGGGGHAHSAATVFEVPPGLDRKKIVASSIKKIAFFLESE